MARARSSQLSGRRSFRREALRAFEVALAATIILLSLPTNSTASSTNLCRLTDLTVASVHSVAGSSLWATSSHWRVQLRTTSVCSLPRGLKVTFRDAAGVAVRSLKVKTSTVSAAKFVLTFTSIAAANRSADGSCVAAPLRVSLYSQQDAWGKRTLPIKSKLLSFCPTMLSSVNFVNAAISTS